MYKAISIDPGMHKCGVILADLQQKKVFRAEVIQSNYLLNYVKKQYQRDNTLQFLIGNGTGSKKFITGLSEFVPNLIILDEKKSTYRAKQRYFEVFPLMGLRKFLPREIFLINKNLDALAALVIMEDYYKYKFEMSNQISIKLG